MAARRARGRVLDEHDDAPIEPSPSDAVPTSEAMHAQAERALVPGHGTIEVGDGQVDRAEGQGGGEGRESGRVHGHQDRSRTAASVWQTVAR